MLRMRRMATKDNLLKSAMDAGLWNARRLYDGPLALGPIFRSPEIARVFSRWPRTAGTFASAPYVTRSKHVVRG